MNKKAISGTVVISLLFLASLAFFFASNEWFSEYSQDLKNTVDQPNLKNYLEISKIDGTNLYLKNDFSDNLTLESIRVGNNECLVNNIEVDKGNPVVDIGGCTAGYKELEAKEIVLITNVGLYQEFEVLRNPVDKSLVVTFQMSPCDFASGYIRMFGLTGLDNAHVDVDGSSTYNVCFRHLDYTISSGTGGAASQDLFYLIGTNNSAVWTTKGSVLINPPSWEDVVLSSNAGTFDYQISTTEPAGGEHTCFGSIDLDNVYGSHIGDCDSIMPDKLWLRIS